jgi:RNA-directed DNA polymerase
MTKAIRHVAYQLGIPVGNLVSVLRTGRDGWIDRRKMVRQKIRPLRIARRELRRVHDAILVRLCPSLRSHRACYCVKGKGALEAARVHARHPYLFHLDLKDFFPSVTTMHVERALTLSGFPDLEAKVIADLVTCDNQLPQGASTSVAVGNAVLYTLDVRIAGICRKHGFSYTRYVDDLAISGGSRIVRLKKLIDRILLEEGWSTRGKGGLKGENQRHSYLGVILNASPNVDRSYVKDLRFLISGLRKEPRSATLSQRISGKLAYITSVNPSLGNSLTAQFKTVASPQP